MLEPPTAYKIPFTTPTASSNRAVGMGVFTVHTPPHIPPSPKTWSRPETTTATSETTMTKRVLQIETPLRIHAPPTATSNDTSHVCKTEGCKIDLFVRVAVTTILGSRGCLVLCHLIESTRRVTPALV